MNNLRTTIIQYDIIWEDKTANFAKLEDQFLNKMKSNETDLIVLPEMFATGFTMNPASFYENENGQTYKWLRYWAKKLNTCIGGGLITKNTNDHYQNTFVVVRPTGETEQYHKRHLFRMGAENEYYVSGIEPKIIDVKGWKVNLQVCYDLRFPVFSRNKMENGEPLYDVLLYIANWPAARANAWSSLLVARAIENQSFVIGVNRVGKDANGIGHSGASAAVSPLGAYVQKPIIEAEKAETTIFIMDTITTFRSIFPVLLDGDAFNITDY